MELSHEIVFLGALLILISVLASVVTARIGVPLLLVFLVLGMLAGEDGPGGILFNNYHAAHFIGTLALAVILFDGGLRTKMKTFRKGLYPALALSTVGVLITAAITGLLAAWLLNLSWLKGLLLGAIIAPTDVAAVFALLQLNQVGLSRRVTATLEVESGSNDPMSIFLALTLTQLIASGKTTISWEILNHFFIQMGLGALLGLTGGYGLVKLVNRLGLTIDFYPLLVMSGGLMIYALTEIAGGNGFLAIYLAGLVIGNSQLKAANYIFNVHNGLAWLSQISMFLMLGLLVTPSELLPHLKQSLIIAFLLIFVARPIAVYASLLPFNFRQRERGFIAWAGLRGAVPIILALFPHMAGLPDANTYFNVVFFVVLISLILQGWTVIPLAHKLNLVRTRRNPLIKRTPLPGSTFELLIFEVLPNSKIIDTRPKDLQLPAGVSLSSVIRDKQMINLNEINKFENGDTVYLISQPYALTNIHDLFVPAR